MRVALSGSSGLVGSHLSRALRERGCEVVTLVRKTPRAGEIRWTPGRGVSPAAALSGVDAVVHLAGTNIADQRWSAARKAAIRESRVEGTRSIVESIRQASPRPRVLISASASGFYGDRGDELLDEEAGAGTGFLAQLCQDWETAANQATALDVRVVTLRFGLVLDQAEGALAKMLPAFRLGLGGRLGSGRQFMSWIHIDDAVRAIMQLLDDEGVSGPINLSSPQPVRNAEFSRVLGRTIRRPALVPVPSTALRLLFGELADEALLASQRMAPIRLHHLKFDYHFTELAAALEDLLARSPQ